MPVTTAPQVSSAMDPKVLDVIARSGGMKDRLAVAKNPVASESTIDFLVATERRLVVQLALLGRADLSVTNIRALGASKHRMVSVAAGDALYKLRHGRKSVEAYMNPYGDV